MKVLKKVIIICFSIYTIIISCKTQSIQSYTSLGNKSIIIINDSCLNYTIKVGGIGAATTIKYKLIGNDLMIDSVDIYKRNSFQDFTNEIFNDKFIYSKDSLVDLTTNERYYNSKFINNSNRGTKNPALYFIMDDKKIKFNSFNRKRIISNLDSTTRELIMIDKKEAKIRYGINEKDITYRIIKK